MEIDGVKGKTLQRMHVRRQGDDAASITVVLEFNDRTDFALDLTPSFQCRAQFCDWSNGGARILSALREFPLGPTV